MDLHALGLNFQLFQKVECISSKMVPTVISCEKTKPSAMASCGTGGEKLD